MVVLSSVHFGTAALKEKVSVRSLLMSASQSSLFVDIFISSLLSSLFSCSELKRERRLQQEAQTLPSAASIRSRQWFSSPPSKCV